ncbi:MAG: DNA alkylation repair protein [Ignavibacteria bacterium]|nr:DNA alkylation repair protein [Ignavibacteria bacterium]
MKHSSASVKASNVAVDPVRELVRVLKPLANPERAVPMKAYLRNQFAFLGIGTEERRRLCFAVDHPSDPLALFDEADALFAKREREYHYCACDVLAKHFRSKKNVADLEKIQQILLKRCEHLITTNSWWDTVDTLAPKTAGAILRGHPNELDKWTRRWISSNNIWLQRSAIIIQLHYKADTVAEVLFDRILQRANSKEFFVQKGAGWALREYAKTDPSAVVSFVAANPQLSALTKREAMK